MVTEPGTPRGALVRRAQDLPVLLSTLQSEVARIRDLLPLIPDSRRAHFKVAVDDSLKDATILADLVTVQQQLTGTDPLDPAARTGFSPSTDEEYDDFDETTHNVPDEPLNEDAKQQLLSVFAVYDSLNSKQVNGVAHAVGCSSQQVRRFFSDMRTRLRSISTAAIRKATKLQAAAAPQHSAAAAGPGAGNYGQPRPLEQHHTSDWPSHLYTNQQQALQQQQQPQGQLPATAGTSMSLSGVATAVDSQAAAAAAAHGPVCSGIAAAVSAQKEKLSKMLDAHNGGAITSGGRFLGALGSISTWAGRTAALTALQASYSSQNNNMHNTGSGRRPGSSSNAGASAAVKGQLGSSRLLDVLEAWLNEAVKDKQVTFIVQTLQVLSVIHLSTALLQGSSITNIVEELQQHQQQQVAAAAQQVMQGWTAATGGAAASGVGWQQQQQHYAAPGGLIALGGQRQATANYKRKLNLAVKKRVAELELLGDLKRSNSAAAAAAKPAPAAAAALTGDEGAQKSLVNTELYMPAAAAAACPSAPAAADRVTSSKLKPPSRRVQLAGTGAAKGPAVAAAANSRQPSDAAKRLAALHNLNKGGQQQRQQQQQHGQGVDQLPPERRLFVMAPHGRAAAAYLAAAGPWAAEVTNATQAYDKAVQRWLSHRPGAAAREQETAAAAMHMIAQQQQEHQQSGLFAGSSVVEWIIPPAVPQEALATVMSGEDSLVARDAASQTWLQQWQHWQQQQQQNGEQQQQQQEPDEAPALASASAAGGGVPVKQIPWHPVNEQRNLKLRCWLWAHGVRLPMHIIKPPSAAEYNRVKQEHERKVARKRQQQAGQQQQQQQQPLGQLQHQAPPPPPAQLIQQQHQQQPAHFIRPQYQQQVPLGYEPPAYQQQLLQQQLQQQQPSAPVLVVGQQQQHYVLQQPPPQLQQPVVIVVPAGQAPPGAVLQPAVTHGAPVGVPLQQQVVHIPQQQQAMLVPQQQQVVPLQQQHQPLPQDGYFPQGY